jgi:hypothetical protein
MDGFQFLRLHFLVYVEIKELSTSGDRKLFFYIGASICGIYYSAFL